MVDEFAHDGGDDDHFRFAGRAEPGGKALQRPVVADRGKRRKVERFPDPGGAQPRERSATAYRGARLAHVGHQTTEGGHLARTGKPRDVEELAEHDRGGGVADARDRHDQVPLGPQRRKLIDVGRDLLFHRADFRFQMRDGGCNGGPHDRGGQLQAIRFLRPHLEQRIEPTDEGLQLPRFGRRRRPGVWVRT